MYKSLRWKVLTILAVFTVFFALGVYPILAGQYKLPAPAWLMAKHLKLGLDLQGGVHLILKVNRDDAVRITTETSSEQMREALQAAGVATSAITVSSPTTCPPTEALARSAIPPSSMCTARCRRSARAKPRRKRSCNPASRRSST